MMPEALGDILDRIAMLPRAARWSVWATVAVVVFLAWDSSIAQLADTWSGRADELERRINIVNAPLVLTSSSRNAITAFGAVELPRDKATGTNRLTEAVQEILAGHSVRNDDFKRTNTSKMRSGSLPGVAGPGRRIEQVIGDLRFDATQTEVMEVVSDLESSPWIDAVSSLRLTRLEGRMIRVNLSLEAWVNSRDERRARR